MRYMLESLRELKPTTGKSKYMYPDESVLGEVDPQNKDLSQTLSASHIRQILS